MIHGVKIKPLGKIADERGMIMHMLRKDDPAFKKFGEIYFSMVYPGVVKGWHYHEKMTLNYAVIQGMIKLVMYDNRLNSPTKGELMEVYTGEANYALITIPPKVWNGVKGIGLTPAIIANCSDIPHDRSEIKRKDPLKNDLIDYSWDIIFR
ncbi:dTDP-4-dehydrorhamnose 3,5-epimerase family protein [Candidatus Roizmanbacteria bacterium]|nr:dTDP-4-dehydrorhamnose 3,5-epimerase family protein [Candidatus Roizmanbacteria bacterium]